MFDFAFGWGECFRLPRFDVVLGVRSFPKWLKSVKKVLKMSK